MHSATPDAIHYSWIDAGFDRLLVAMSAVGLRCLVFERGSHFDSGLMADWVESRRRLAEPRRQIQQYLQGNRRSFDLPLDMHGTKFQRKIWSELQQIPWGQTTTYGELAKRIGNPRSSRAVGAANGRNPVSIVVPCHRVIGSRGMLTGYGGGLENKVRLLELEGHTIQNGQLH